MAKRTYEKTYLVEDFERKAQELIHIMLTLCEERIYAVPRLNAPVGKTMAEAAMSVKYAIRTFIAVERLKGK